MKKLFTFFAIFSIVSTMVNAKEEVLWKSGFHAAELGKPVAGYNKYYVVKEENGERFLSLGPVKTLPCITWFSKQAIHRNQKSHTVRTDYEFRLKVRFINIPDCEIIVKSGGEDPDFYYLCYVNFNKTAMLTKCYAAQSRQELKYQEINYSKVGLSNLKNGIWYELAVRAMNKTVDIYRKENGKMVKIVSYEVVPGSDYVSFLFVGNYVDLTGLKVVQLADPSKRTNNQFSQ